MPVATMESRYTTGSYTTSTSSTTITTTIMHHHHCIQPKIQSMSVSPPLVVTLVSSGVYIIIMCSYFRYEILKRLIHDHVLPQTTEGGLHPSKRLATQNDMQCTTEHKIRKAACLVVCLNNAHFDQSLCRH